MSNFIDTAVTTNYRGYEIRTVGDVSRKRHIIKKGGKIVSEQVDLEAVRKLIDELVEESRL